MNVDVVGDLFELPAFGAKPFGVLLRRQAEAPKEDQGKD